MMKLAVLAAEQAWAHTIAPPAASLALCYEARLVNYRIPSALKYHAQHALRYSEPKNPKLR
jgi:hypothetical protein